MNKPCAISVKQYSLSAIIELSKIARLAREQCAPQESETLMRAAGNLIGLIETDILALIYREYPDLDDLA